MGFKTLGLACGGTWQIPVPLRASVRGVVGCAPKALWIPWPIRERQTKLGTYTVVAEPLRDPARCRAGRSTVIRQTEMKVKVHFG